MQKTGPSPTYHEIVLDSIVPRMLKTIQEQIPQAKSESDQAQQINEWTARLVESYMTEEQITKHCELQNALSKKIMEERKNIGMELYKAATTKQLTKNDLDTLLKVCQAALEQLKEADHFAPTLNFIGKYLTLFSMNEENPNELGGDVLRLLEIFRQKMFPE